MSGKLKDSHLFCSYAVSGNLSFFSRYPFICLADNNYKIAEALNQYSPEFHKYLHLLSPKSISFSMADVDKTKLVQVHSLSDNYT